MAKQNPLTLERIVRDARRHHTAAQYPGDLAADLGLESPTAARRARPAWLTRWVPAFAAAAALLLGAAVVWQSLQAAGTNTTPDPGPATAHHTPGPTAPSPPQADPPQPRKHHAVELARSIPPAVFLSAAQKIEAASVRASDTAVLRLHQQWVGRKTPTMPTMCAIAIRLSLGSIPNPHTPDYNLPRGLRLSVPSLSTLRKELS